MVVVIVLLMHRYGYDPCPNLVWWCWVARHPKDDWSTFVAWQLVSGKLWETLSYILVCTLYAIVKIKLARHVRISYLTLSNQFIFLQLFFIYTYPLHCYCRNIALFKKVFNYTLAYFVFSVSL